MNKTLAVVVLALVLVVGVFAYLNWAEGGDRLQSQREATLFIVSGGERTHTVDFSDIEDLEQREFTATLRSSGSSPRDLTYTGVQLRHLLEHLDLDMGGIDQIVTRAADGYTVALGADEVSREDNVYIVYMIDGEPLAPKEAGGSGPYQLVIREDEFGQRWNKFLMEIELQ